MALNNIPISEDQCIGDSLDTINDSFEELDSRTLNLSSSIAVVTNQLITNCGKVKFTGNGSVTFNASSLIGTQTNAFLYRVDVNGVVQEPGTNSSNGDYYLNSGNLIFTTAPANGTKIIIVGPSFA
jgi:hypothetical protein